MLCILFSYLFYMPILKATNISLSDFIGLDRELKPYFDFRLFQYSLFYPFEGQCLWFVDIFDVVGIYLA